MVSCLLLYLSIIPSPLDMTLQPQVAQYRSDGKRRSAVGEERRGGEGEMQRGGAQVLVWI